MGAMRFSLDGEEVAQQQVLSKLHDADPSLRKAAAAAFTDGLKVHNRTLTFIFNTILQDKATDDRLRGYPSWISSRNLSNEVADRDVDALIGAVTGSYGHVHRFYRLKRRLLGLDVLHDYDRYAPVGEADTHISWDEARRVVTDSYAAFHPELGTIVDRFFEKRWIDAALHPSKRGGAFSHGAVPSAHPYILMNYTGKVRDVQTLAHELGHGVHQYLSREQGVFHADTPLTTAETASVFGEMLVFQRLLANESDPSVRLAMLMGKIDDTMATVYRQVTMNRFEDRIHTLRREEGEMGADQFAEAWMETQSAMYGDSVVLTDDYRWWWSYIPHFLHTPGYVYAYAFGELLVLALYERYTSSGADFPDRYRDLLAAGGSDWPHELVGRMGIDLRDASFWKSGVDMIGRLVDEAEALAQTMVDR
jgi:oligoendopeptidase F